MSAVQLSFTLRTSSNVKTVHLLGSWDNYAGQLPLSRDHSKPGAWKGTFRFQNSTLEWGERYWYYYIMDGYHVTHDPAQPYTTEHTTGRRLNILDVPDPDPTYSSRNQNAHAGTRRQSNRISLDIPHGRGISPSKIKHPRPEKPYASRAIREADYNISPTSSSGGSDSIDALTTRFESYRLSVSPPSSISSIDSSSMSERSSGSSPTSFSSLSDRSIPTCRCERYAILRTGERIKIDCGGERCGYMGSESGSSVCSSDSEEEYYRRQPRSPRRETFRSRK